MAKSQDNTVDPATLALCLDDIAAALVQIGDSQPALSRVAMLGRGIRQRLAPPPEAAEEAMTEDKKDG